MDFKRCFKRTVFVVLLLGTVMLAGTMLAFDGARRGISIDAASDPSIFTFAPTSGTECDVRLSNKSVTRAIIPNTTVINGVEHTVTSIATNSFSSAPNLEKVWIPYTVRAIGATAFANCPNLKSVTMPAVQTIGANAFMQTGLEFLIIPETTISVGATILRNNSTKVYVRTAQSQTANWASAWNGNNSQSIVDYESNFTPEIEYEYVNAAPAPRGIISTNSSVNGYVVSDYQPFVDQNDINVYIPAVHNGEPVVGIADFAFIGNHTQTITIAYANDPIRIGEYAFYAFLGQTITINRDITFETDYGTPADAVFASSNISKIVLPNTLTEIGNCAFNYCSNLANIHFVTPQLLTQSQEQSLANTLPSTGIVNLPSSITTIDTEAFVGTNAIIKMYIPNTIQTVGFGVFVGWSNSQTLSIDFYNINLPIGWNALWNSGCNANIEYNIPRYTVVYDANQPADASASVVGTTPNSSHVIGTPSPFSMCGFSLTGWRITEWKTVASGSGVVYPLNSSYNLTNTPNSTVTLYAQWTPIYYTITYNANRPAYASFQVQGYMFSTALLYDSASPLQTNNFTCQNFTFVGWRTQADGSGTFYSDGQIKPNVSDGNAILYAQWSAIETFIYTAADLNNIRNNPSAYYVLANDIDLSGYANWTPIPYFTGTLNGGANRKISNMNISYTTTYNGLSTGVRLGLFAVLDGIFVRAQISNCRIIATCTLSMPPLLSMGYLWAGLIAGTVGINGKILNTNLIDTNVVSVKHYESEVGGVVGELVNGSLQMVVNAGTLTINGQGYLGGFVGAIRGGSVGGCDITNVTINYTRYLTTNHGVGILTGNLVNANSISLNNIHNCAVILQNVSSGTLIGVVAGVGTQDLITLFIGNWFSNGTTNKIHLSNGTIKNIDSYFGHTY